MASDVPISTADSIDALTPDQREEAQVAMLRIYNARHSFGRPERRAAWLARMPPVQKIQPATAHRPPAWRQTDVLALRSIPLSNMDLMMAECCAPFSVSADDQRLLSNDSAAD
jgi:hypothetical protein